MKVILLKKKVIRKTISRKCGKVSIRNLYLQTCLLTIIPVVASQQVLWEIME